MIRDELQKDGYEIWHPSLGGPGLCIYDIIKINKEFVLKA